MVEPVVWTSRAGGTLGGLTLELLDISVPFARFTADTTGPNFSAAPLPAEAEFLDYQMDSSWTLTLSEPVETLYLYGVFWRGNQNFGEVDPTIRYEFDRPFEIASGFSRATVDLNALELPDDSMEAAGMDEGGFHSGILRFDGPLSSLSLSTVNPLEAGHGQGLTFAVPVPEASTLTLWAGVLCSGMAGWRQYRRRNGR